MLEEIHRLPCSVLAALTLDIVNTFDDQNNDGRVFEILPKILCSVLWEEEINLEELNLENMSGNQKSHKPKLEFHRFFFLHSTKLHSSYLLKKLSKKKNT